MAEYRLLAQEIGQPILPMGTIAAGQVLGRVGDELVGVTVEGAGNPTYAPGDVTIGNGEFKIMAKRLALTSTQRLTIEGTGRLRII